MLVAPSVCGSASPSWFSNKWQESANGPVKRNSRSRCMDGWTDHLRVFQLGRTHYARSNMKAKCNAQASSWNKNLHTI